MEADRGIFSSCRHDLVFIYLNLVGNWIKPDVKGSDKYLLWCIPGKYYFENNAEFEVENFLDCEYYTYKNAKGEFVKGINNASDYDFVARLFNLED
jgi:hypothetical protein